MIGGVVNARTGMHGVQERTYVDAKGESSVHVGVGTGTSCLLTQRSLRDCTAGGDLGETEGEQRLGKESVVQVEGMGVTCKEMDARVATPPSSPAFKEKRTPGWYSGCYQWRFSIQLQS